MKDFFKFESKSTCAIFLDMKTVMSFLFFCSFIYNVYCLKFCETKRLQFENPMLNADFINEKNLIFSISRI